MVREEEFDHITLAFSYGDGAKGSCENTALEVSQLMKGLPIDHYLAADISTLNLLNDAVGGVTVTIPAGLGQADPEFVEGSQVRLKGSQAERFVRYRDTAEDHSALLQADPEFVEGSQVRLKGSQAERFVRYRDTAEDHSALFRTLRGQEFITEGSQVRLKGSQAERFVRYRDTAEDHSALFRTLRGQEFITGFFKAAQEMSKQDSQTVPHLFEMVEDYMITDMGKEQYLGMAADALASQSLTSEDFYVLPGSAVVTETYDEYHADEAGMVEVLLELFYREA